jgi:hypothetical protein
MPKTYFGESGRGSPSERQVILKFETEEAAERWYHDPEYTRVKQIRLDSTKNGSLVFREASRACGVGRRPEAGGSLILRLELPSRNGRQSSEYRYHPSRR